MFKLLVNNSIVATAKLASDSETLPSITRVRLVINYPNSTEVEVDENVGNYTYLHRISDTEVGYRFVPNMVGIYTFTWVVESSGVTSTSNIKLLVQ